MQNAPLSLPNTQKSDRHSERSEESYKVFYKADSIAMEVVIIPGVQKNVRKLGMTRCIERDKGNEAARFAGVNLDVKMLQTRRFISPLSPKAPVIPKRSEGSY